MNGSTVDSLASAHSSRKPIRRWFQMGIRTTLILTAGCAVVIATFGRRAVEAQRLFETNATLLSLDCQIQFEKDDSLIVRPLRYLLGQDHYLWDKVTSIVSSNSRLTDEDLKNFKTLTDLRILRLSNSPISDRGAEHLIPLSNLEELVLLHTRVSRLDFTARMHNLTSLELSNTQLDDVSGLARNPLLSTLNLPLTGLRGKDLEVISKLENLRALDVSYANMEEEDLRHLQGMGLTKLVLIGVNVSDTAMQYLSSLDELSYLDLSYAPITGQGLSLIAPRPTLTSLLLEDTDIDDSGLEVVGQFVGLQELSLEGLRITDEGLVHLRNLQELKSLDLEGTRIDGTGLRHLKPLQSLETICLYNVPVTDAGLAHLHDLPRLHHVDVWNSRASQAVIDSLRPRRPDMFYSRNPSAVPRP